jgi:hypothetical protein
MSKTVWVGDGRELELQVNDVAVKSMIAGHCSASIAIHR